MNLYINLKHVVVLTVRSCGKRLCLIKGRVYTMIKQTKFPRIEKGLNMDISLPKDSIQEPKSSNPSPSKGLLKATS